MNPLKKTEKTRLRRSPAKAVFDRDALYQIFDESMIGHVGFSMDDQPFVIPMLVWRVGNKLYLHGSNGSRMIKALTTGAGCCITATLVDGMVLSRSAFHHSTNYRSAMVFGPLRTVDDPAETNEALQMLLEQVTPGRWEDIRPPSKNELAATSVLAIEIEEASVKVRTGGPVEDEDDLERPVWAGELVMRQVAGKMVADQYVKEGIAVPDYSAAWGERWQDV